MLISILVSVIVFGIMMLLFRPWQQYRLGNRKISKLAHNSTKAKIVTSSHCIMNYCAMGEAECVADKQHCPYDQRGKT